MVEAAAAARVDAASARFELSLVDSGGAGWRTGLSADVPVEDGVPVRSFRWSRKLGHYPGWWWAATTGRHVGYESWLERDHLMLLDFDPEVTAIASQPFWLHWTDGQRVRRHAPDFFARLRDGAGVVVDVRADERIQPVDAEAFAAMAWACAEAG